MDSHKIPLQESTWIHLKTDLEYYSSAQPFTLIAIINRKSSLTLQCYHNYFRVSLHVTSNRRAIALLVFNQPGKRTRPRQNKMKLLLCERIAPYRLTP